MNKPRQPNSLNSQIRNEAVEWLLRFSEEEVDSAGHEEFNSWLRTSPEHVRGYLQVAAFWQEAGHIDGKAGPRDIDALISQAKQEGNIVPLALGPLPNEAAPSPEERPNARRRSMAHRFFAAAAVLLVAVGIQGVHHYLTRNVYETKIGEQRTINLADGSTLILNADSRVHVRYSQAERSIDLEAGQALFKVAKNPLRPFVVRSDGASVRAVGTQFDVYRKSTGTTVTVVEGKVAVSSEEKPGAGEGGEGPGVADAGGALTQKPVLFLIAGEQITLAKINLADANVPLPDVHPVKVEEATAWTDGLLIFNGTPLSEVILEYNRQNSKPLVLVGSPDLGEIKISGTFPANGADRITRFLQERFSVAARETDDRIVLTR